MLLLSDHSCCKHIFVHRQFISVCNICKLAFSEFAVVLPPWPHGDIAGSLSVQGAYCEWSVSKQALHCQETLHPVSILGEYQCDALLDLCWRMSFMPERDCWLVKCLHASKHCLVCFPLVGYHMPATGDSTFASLSLSPKIKKMDGCIETPTGKASCTGPVGSLPHLFMLRDCEIAASFYCKSDSHTDRPILLHKLRVIILSPEWCAAKDISI